MTDYRPERDIKAVKAFSFALMAAPLFGLFLLLTGLGTGSYVRVGLGALFLAASPFVVRRVWRGTD
jgi:hypothetical protein